MGASRPCAGRSSTTRSPTGGRTSSKSTHADGLDEGLQWVCRTSTKSFAPAPLVLGEPNVCMPELAKLPIEVYVPDVGSYHRAVTCPASWPMFTTKLWDV